MSRVIQAYFDPEFRRRIFLQIKHHGGPQYNEKKMIEAGYHPSFARALIRSITRNEGW